MITADTLDNPAHHPAISAGYRDAATHAALMVRSLRLAMGARAALWRCTRRSNPRAAADHLALAKQHRDDSKTFQARLDAQLNTLRPE